MALERRTPLPRGGSLKRTPMKRTAMKRTAKPREPKARRPSKPDPLTADIREEVAVRSGGWCEARASARCGRVARQVHHRQLRRGDDHRLVNLLHVCTPCHDAIHGAGSVAYTRGMLVSQYDDPAAIPVVVGPLC